MSYKLPDPPPDTPCVNGWEFASAQDCYGQIGGLVCSNKARILERENNALRAMLDRVVERFKYRIPQPSRFISAEQDEINERIALDLELAEEAKSLVKTI